MTQKVNNGLKRLIKNFKSFSLIELIIVIAIIAILSIAGFMTLTKWIGKSRDSRRLSDLETIKKSLTVNRLDIDTSEDYPMPDPDDSGKLLTGEINGQKLAYRGTFGSGVVKELSSLTKTSKDPNGERYAYGITKDKKKFEIAAVLEGGEEVSYNFTDKIYAGEKYSVVKGNYDGAIVYTSGDDRKYIANVPSLIYNFSGEISLINTGNIVYIVNKGRNLAYGEGYESINENFEEVLKKRYNLPETTTELTVVNTGVEELGNSLENNSISTGVIDSLGGSKGFVEKKLEEGGVSVDSNEEETSCGDGYFLEGGECKIQWTGDGTSSSPFVYKDQSGNIKYPQSCNDILTGGETEYETANISSSVTYSGGSSSEFRNGVYKIDPDGDGSGFEVYCDMNTDGGGWTLLLNQKNGYRFSSENVLDKNSSTPMPNSDLYSILGKVDLITLEKEYLYKNYKTASNYDYTITTQNPSVLDDNGDTSVSSPEGWNIIKTTEPGLSKLNGWGLTIQNTARTKYSSNTGNRRWTLGQLQGPRKSDCPLVTNHYNDRNNCSDYQYNFWTR